MGINQKITLDEYATTLIRLKARQLIGKYGFTKSDREDIQQELTLDLLMRLDRFDPRKAKPTTFVRLIVDRHVATLLRKRTSRARDYRRTLPVLGELSDEGGNGVDGQLQRDLAIDLAEALAELPDDERSIADDLCHGSPADSAHERHCDPGALRRSAELIRQHLARCGLDEYIFSRVDEALRM